MASALTLKLFGAFEAHLDTTPLSALQYRDGERLMAYLALQHGRPLSTQTTVQALWPETESMDRLRQSITHLRRNLADQGHRLQTPKGSLLLDLTEAEVDFITFDAALEAGDESSLQKAVALYRGPLLPKSEDKWIIPEREKRRDDYLAALKTLSTASYKRKDYTTAAYYLRRYVRVNASEERVWHDLLQTLILGGERVVALEFYRRYRDYLLTRYGLTPSEELTALYEQIKERPLRHKAVSDENIANLDATGGAVRLQSPLYIERNADKLFLAAVARRDSIVLVKGARQTGKTSLLARGLAAARAQNIRVVFADLQKLSSAHWVSTETFYQALAQNIADQLNLEVQPGMGWDKHRGANENFERFLRREVLGKVSAPLLLALDEVDKLFVYPFCNEVFALFRSWHNERALDPEGPWEQLTLAIAYATEAHLFISDINQSPFNVGTRLTLEDFTFPQVEDLHRRLTAPLGAAALQRFYDLLGGSPYLIHRGLHEIVTRRLDFDTFLAQATQDTGCFGDHLQRLLIALKQDVSLNGVVQGLLQGLPCPDPQSYYRLRSGGVILGDAPENARFRCPLYQTYLKAHLP